MVKGRRIRMKRKINLFIGLMMRRRKSRKSRRSKGRRRMTKIKLKRAKT
jgi:hypothetical protein